MAPATRRRDGATSTARCIMNVLSEDSHGGNGGYDETNGISNNENVIVWDKNHLTLALEDLQESLENRLVILKSQASKAKDVQKQSWVNATVKIRKSVKEMTVKDFNLLYNCDLLTLLQQPALSKKRRGGWNAVKTPAPSKPPSGISTVTRTAKRGEAIFSENGSPVDTVEDGALIATVTKKRRIRAGDAPVNFDINVGDGQYISLNNPGSIGLLDEGLKSTAIQQLQILQDQMASLMAQLKN